jgi:hypothetical protein
MHLEKTKKSARHTQRADGQTPLGCRFLLHIYMTPPRPRRKRSDNFNRILVDDRVLALPNFPKFLRPLALRSSDFETFEMKTGSVLQLWVLDFTVFTF